LHLGEPGREGRLPARLGVQFDRIGLNVLQEGRDFFRAEELLLLLDQAERAGGQASAHSRSSVRPGHQRRW